MTTSHMIRSIQVGQPEERHDGTRPWTSAIHKQPVAGPIWLGLTNLDGDAQADRRVHGGPDKAVCVYPAVHETFWCAQLGLTSLPPGGFGENLTVDGPDETEVCVGDIYSIGDVKVQISQPRSPCWKLARRWGVRDLAVRVQQTGYTGWYLRVLTTGAIQPGDEFVLDQRLHPEWTVRRASAVYRDRHDTVGAAALRTCDALGASWRDTLARRLRGSADDGDEERLRGER